MRCQPLEEGRGGEVHCLVGGRVSDLGGEKVTELSVTAADDTGNRSGLGPLHAGVFHRGF